MNKYYKLYEDFSELNSIKLEDVIGSVEDYIYKTYNVDYSELDNPYGCESKEILEDVISMDNLWEEYDIDTKLPEYWLTHNFIKMMSDIKCHVSLPFRFEYCKQRLMKLTNPIKIFRCVSVDDNYIQQFLKGEIHNLGKYWAYDKQNVRAQMAEQVDKLLVFECYVDSKYVDWKRTILYNLNYYVGFNEAEIIIKGNPTLKLNKIYYSDNNGNETTFPFYSKRYKELNIDLLKNKDFYL